MSVRRTERWCPSAGSPRWRLQGSEPAQEFHQGGYGAVPRTAVRLFRPRIAQNGDGLARGLRGTLQTPSTIRAAYGGNACSAGNRRSGNGIASRVIERRDANQGSASERICDEYRPCFRAILQATGPVSRFRTAGVRGPGGLILGSRVGQAIASSVGTQFGSRRFSGSKSSGSLTAGCHEDDVSLLGVIRQSSRQNHEF